jgi:hypothetical protein
MDGFGSQIGIQELVVLYVFAVVAYKYKTRSLQIALSFKIPSPCRIYVGDTMCMPINKIKRFYLVERFLQDKTIVLGVPHFRRPTEAKPASSLKSQVFFVFDGSAILRHSMKPTPKDEIHGHSDDEQFIPKRYLLLSSGR